MREEVKRRIDPSKHIDLLVLVSKLAKRIIMARTDPESIVLRNPLKILEPFLKDKVAVVSEICNVHREIKCGEMRIDRVVCPSMRVRVGDFVHTVPCI